MSKDILFKCPKCTKKKVVFENLSSTYMCLNTEEGCRFTGKELTTPLPSAVPLQDTPIPVIKDGPIKSIDDLKGKIIKNVAYTYSETEEDNEGKPFLTGIVFELEGHSKKLRITGDYLQLKLIGRKEKIVYEDIEENL